MTTSQPSTQSAAERRAAEAEVRRLIAKFATGQERLVAGVRRSLRKRLPTAHEVVYEYKDAFVISFSPSGHGYEGVLVIRGSARGVQLYFNRGKGLPDPGKLLRGSSQSRWMHLEKASTLARGGRQPYRRGPRSQSRPVCARRPRAGCHSFDIGQNDSVARPCQIRRCSRAGRVGFFKIIALAASAAAEPER